ncbi:uncharacterized protein LOC132699632 isoform X2 [Cylas formicarius]|uniref:uncharacterized protein LOC132699632 isoform X2 n=1 Tax=Cylas formicarius TaxID=197179 RepID=UPI002958762C|nr:uncharacterized protein LOC132699632 isoform X2 [Cylas formicarius]
MGLRDFKIQTFVKISVCLHILIHGTTSLPSNENSKFLGNELPQERRRRPLNQGPCNFGGYGKPKNEASERFFLDFQFLNVENNHNYNINCGGGHPVSENYPVADSFGGYRPGKPILNGNKPFQGGYKPTQGGHHKPHKPGGLFNGGGFFENRPILSGFLFGNRPQGPHGPEESSPQSQQGAFSGSFAGILPTPQQFGQGLGEGIQSFLQTIPQIGQSFQSLLPTFDNFQLPQLPSGPLQFPALSQGGPVSNNNFNRPESISGVQPTRPQVAPPPPTTTIDPDDIIYNDEIKPVHEDYDPVTDFYNNKLPPGNRREPRRRYFAENGKGYRNNAASNPQVTLGRSISVLSRQPESSGTFKFPS